jgi:hypothetical protein
MTATRRNVMWPLITIAAGGLWLLMVAGAVPDTAGDLLVRAWPALLILFGFDVLLGRRRLRVARWAVHMNVLGLILTLLLLAAVVWMAYSRQADVLRTDNVQAFGQTITEDITQLQLDLSVSRTTVTISPAPDNPRDIRAQFKGSRESRVEMSWAVDGDAGVFTVREQGPGTIPKLEDYGRGTLDITLPQELFVQLIALRGKQGDVTLALQPVRVNQVEIDVDKGDLTLSLPTQDVLTGKLRTGDGGIELLVPPEMALNVSLQPGSGKPEYHYEILRYDVLINGDLKLKNAGTFQISLDVWLKGGAPLTVTDLQ